MFFTAEVMAISGARCTINYMCLSAGVDGTRTEKARSGMLIVLCQVLVELGVVHTSSPAFPFPHKKESVV